MKKTPRLRVSVANIKENKMKRTFFPILSIFSALMMSACGLALIPGSGKIVSEARVVTGFNRVVLAAPGQMSLTQNGSEALKIETDDNLLQYIHTRVDGGTLYIEVEPGANLMPSKDIHYTLSVKSLQAFDLDGSASVSSAGLQSDQFEVNLNGSGDISLGKVNVDTLTFNLDGSGSLNVDTLAARKVTLGMNGSGTGTLDGLTADELQAGINGSGKYVLQGKVTRQSLQTIGSGDYQAQQLESQQTNITITGSGDSQVWATQQLNVSIFGSGTVAYQGTPKLTQQISGSGSIHAID